MMSNDIIEGLLDKVKNNDIVWIRMGFFKEYLKNEQKSLRDVKIFQDYLAYLQKTKFVFDCVDTYISIKEDCLYILAKRAKSFDFRLDVLELTTEMFEWKPVIDLENVLSRLRNAIMVTNSDSEKECREFLLKL